MKIKLAKGCENTWKAIKQLINGKFIIVILKIIPTLSTGNDFESINPGLWS